MLWSSTLVLAVVALGPVPDDGSAASLQSVEARVESEFATIEAEFRAARTALAKAQGAPNAKIEPPELRLAFIERMQPLADAGFGPAIAWILNHFAANPRDPRDPAEIKIELYERILPRHAGEPWVFDDEIDLIDALTADRALLGERLTSKWAHALFAATEPSNHEHRLRALRLEAEALAPLGEADLDRRLNAANVWQRELNAAPQGPFAAYCKNALWRLRHLVVGENAPDFSGIDVDGNEIQLDDFRDKVIVVGFFSFERTGDRQRAIQFHRLASQFESEPFALVGVNQDPQPNVFRKLWEEYELRFPCVFEGGRHGRVASAWHLDAPPKNLVIDRAGRLRYVDLDAAALEQAVAELISESASADKIPRTTNSRR